VPGGFRQTEIHTAEPLVPEPSAAEVEVAIRKLKGISRQVLIRFQQNRFNWVGGVRNLRKKNVMLHVK
jgi:hypothetical protein